MKQNREKDRDKNSRGIRGPGSGVMRKAPYSIIQPICSKSSFGLGFLQFEYTIYRKPRMENKLIM